MARGTTMAQIWRMRLVRFARETVVCFSLLSFVVGAVLLFCGWLLGWNTVFGPGMEATLRPYVLSLPFVAAVMAAGSMLQKRERRRD